MTFQILSLSGGGFLGLYTAAVLSQLEEPIGNPIIDSFDLIAGTSVGGIIALGLSAGRSASEIKEAFLEDGHNVFSSDRPPPAKERRLGVDDPWTDAPELGMLAKVFEQDVFNMARVQTGLESTRKPGVTFSNYQESKIRWLHRLLGEWVGEWVGERVGELDPSPSETAVNVGRRQ